MKEGTAFSLKPTTSKERIEMIDALRGFALAGVCLANLSSFSLYYYLDNGQKAVLPLMQTVINILIFNGIGFGLGGKIGPSLYILWFFVWITLQILFSRWWLSRYMFGPVEWLWRSLTYGQWQPMIRKIPQVAI